MKAAFEYPAKILEITEKNESFDACVIRIMYHGLNRKNMRIDKATVEKAIPSIYYCPVVANYDIEADTFGGHDIAVVKREDGSIRMVNLTDGIGVVPNEAEWYWEPVTEEDGTVHEYLCINAILWKRSAAYDKIKRDGYAAHSMEININAYHKENGVMVIDDFTFEAFTVIGVEPCFESSNIHFSFDRDSLSLMLEDYKKAFSLVNPEASPASVDNTNNNEEGGDTQLNIAELLAEFSLAEEDVDFEIGDMTEEEVRAKFTAIAEAKSQSAEPVQPAPAEDPAEPEQAFSLTAVQIEEQIFAALKAYTMYDAYWREQTDRYWYQDRDDALCEVYLYDRQERYTVGVPYSMSGDKVVMDFNAAKRKRIQYVDFNEGANDPLATLFSAAQKDMETHVDALNAKIGDLEKFRADTEAAQAEGEAQAVFAMFSDLTGNAAFDEIVANHGGMSRDEIENACYALRGRNVTVKFSANDKPNRVPVEPEHASASSDEPYNGLFTKYLK